MTTRYLDPAGGSDSNDGASIGAPWRSLYWATAVGNPNKLATGDSLLIKADSDWSISGQFIGLQLTAKSNVTIGTYGSGAMPICRYNRDMPSTLMSAGEIAGTPLTVMSKWYEVDPADGVTPYYGSRLWRINIQNYFAGFVYVTFGTGNDLGFRGPFWFQITDAAPLSFDSNYLPQADGEWDAREGVDASDPAAFLCWAPDPLGPVNYYGRIRWQSAQEPVFRIQDCSSVLIDGIGCADSALLARFIHPNTTGSGSILQNCQASDSGMLATMYGGGRNSGIWAQNWQIKNNRAIRTHAIAINPSDNIQDGVIEGNYMEDCGLIRSDGGIYFGNGWAPAGHEIHVRRNYSLRQRYGNYWLWDGRAVMTDSDTANVWIYGNVVKDSHQAFGSNSGVAGIRLWGNISLGCDHGYVESDLLGYSDSGSGRAPQDTIIANNSFLGCGIRRWYQDDGKSPESYRQVPVANDGAIVLGNRSAGSLGMTRVLNNVVTAGRGDIAPVASGMTILDTTVGKYTLTNNCFYGWKQVLGKIGSAQSVDPSNITSNPQLDGAVPLPASPLVGAGVDWWTADGKVGFGGAPGAPVPAHIGAVMPLPSAWR